MAIVTLKHGQAVTIPTLTSGDILRGEPGGEIRIVGGLNQSSITLAHMDFTGCIVRAAEPLRLSTISKVTMSGDLDLTLSAPMSNVYIDQRGPGMVNLGGSGAATITGLIVRSGRVQVRSDAALAGTVHIGPQASAEALAHATDRIDDLILHGVLRTRREWVNARVNGRGARLIAEGGATCKDGSDTGTTILDGGMIDLRETAATFDRLIGFAGALVMDALEGSIVFEDMEVLDALCSVPRELSGGRTITVTNTRKSYGPPQGAAYTGAGMPGPGLAGFGV